MLVTSVYEIVTGRWHSLRALASHTELTKSKNVADFKTQLIVYLMICCLNHNILKKENMGHY